MPRPSRCAASGCITSPGRWTPSRSWPPRSRRSWSPVPTPASRATAPRRASTGRPGRQRVRGDVDAAPGRLGSLRALGADRAARPAGRARAVVRTPDRRAGGGRGRGSPAMTAPALGPVSVAAAGSTDPTSPLVVLLHGRGSDEREIVALADHLPSGPAYAAVRAPIAEGAGYAWFANRGIGRPITDSLRQTMTWFRAWLDEVAAPQRPVVVVGFSGGAASAGGLVLTDPRRFAGAALLYGTLPFDAGVPVTPARLAGLPVFVAHGEQDTVIPRELLDRTWAYLVGDSGASVHARRDPGGHGISRQTLAELAAWIGERTASAPV